MRYFRKFSSDDVVQAIFGASDGATGAVGLIGSFYVSGHRSAIGLGCISIAVAAALSMAGGEFISDVDSSIRSALVMGFATLFGGLAPAIPFFLFGFETWVLLIVLAVVCSIDGVIVHSRAKTVGWKVASVQVYSIFIIVSIATVGIGLLAPSGGAT